jgi:hypothetical protein
MRFSRFTWLGFMSNWGWYSAKEKELLALEAGIARELINHPELIGIGRMGSLVQEFLNIQNNQSVEFANYGKIETKLKALRDNLNVLLQSPTPVFANHQPDALVGEIRTHLAMRKNAREGRTRPTTAIVVHFNTKFRQTHGREDPRLVTFRKLIATGQKFLWAYDVDGILSIGDPNANKHSVVGVGKNVYGAGIAQLKLDARTDQYMAMKDQEARAEEMERNAKALPDGDRRELLLANADELRKMAAYERKALGDWVPPAHADEIVELDFDSGHYAPRAGWTKPEEAWGLAGYRVTWSTTSRYS